MLRQLLVDGNSSSNRRGCFLMLDWRRDCVWTVSTADSGCHSGSQVAYPPPRESCVRGADRAAVDKRFRLAIRSISWEIRGETAAAFEGISSARIVQLGLLSTILTYRWPAPLSAFD